jgi:hypothetical protein
MSSDIQPGDDEDLEGDENQDDVSLQESQSPTPVSHGYYAEAPVAVEVADKESEPVLKPALEPAKEDLDGFWFPQRASSTKKSNSSKRKIKGGFEF